MAIGVILDENGLSVRSYREIRSELEKGLQGIFGRELILDPSSPDGQLIDLFGYAYDEVKEALLGAISGLDVASAQGVFLDNIAMIMGQRRNEGESDDELRSRLLKVDNKGLSTFDGMLTYLRDQIHGSVTMAENPEPEQDSDGIPGHSFVVYIPKDVYEALEEKEKTEEGFDADNYIAQKIWNCKPAGIKAYGNKEGVANDIAQMPHTVKFSAITSSPPFYMKITVTEYTDESLPMNYKTAIKEAVAEWALTEYTGGKDVIPQRAIQAIYKVQGIDTVTVEVSTDGTTFSTNRIAVAADKYAVLPETNIEVLGP